MRYMICTKAVPASTTSIARKMGSMRAYLFSQVAGYTLHATSLQIASDKLHATSPGKIGS